jgi:hypothetical protein
LGVSTAKKKSVMVMLEMAMTTAKSEMKFLTLAGKKFCVRNFFCGRICESISAVVYGQN